MKNKRKIIIISLVIIISIISSIIINDFNTTYEDKDISIANNKESFSNLSYMLETGIDTNEYEESSDSSFPSDDYIFNADKSGCENGGILSYDEDTGKIKLKNNISDRCYLYFDKYNYATIDSISSTVTTSSITVNVSATKGETNIAKYAYSIEGSDYVESTSSSYTFSNLSSNTTYSIKVKVIDSNNKETIKDVSIITDKVLLTTYVTNLASTDTTNLAIDDAGNVRYIGGEYCEYTADGTTYKYAKNSSGTCSTRYNYVRTTVSDSSTTTYTNQSSCPSNDDTYTYSCTAYTGTIAGTEPNNYVSFNGELWRIIGVFDVDDGAGTTEKRIKLIRNDLITSIGWDYKQTSVGTSTTTSGSNDWTDSQLMMYLNTSVGYTLPTNYTKTDGLVKDSNGYMVYQEGCKLASVTTSTSSYSCTSSSFTLTSTAQSQIADTVWNLGAANSGSSWKVSDMYTAERGTTVYSGHATSWTGKVGLMYPSDYGYATGGGDTYSRETCLGYNLSSWNSYKDCYRNDWIYNSSYDQWFLSPNSGNATGVFYLTSGGRVSGHRATIATAARPVVYLVSDIGLSGGTGTSSDPYILST